ncbi:TRAP transporter substrate-binding protein [Krasilnikoviella flava]|uniref:Tripartite ATP-independent transporter solute receptor, DctP family n=1 Tax=Krasilnikoviella flava TaxID=526729 RepID=A0A1T5LEW6_9MICO|nr:TRAP transporter substrate-binding protein [Krasilnikoviella flava]SKC74576.1 tripartite ATP-independent transporter solute receptor, DctP family [Krasilnikoviella flava]
MRLRQLAAAGSAALVAVVLTACGAGFTTAAAGAGATEGAGAPEAERVFKVAFNQNADQPEAVALTRLGERLAERTDGRYSVEVYPNETLGAQKDTVELVQSGAVDLALVAGSLLENINADFVALNMPYVYDSQAHQEAVLNDPAITGDLYSSLEEQNIRVLGGFSAGVRSVYTSAHPIETPADLAGLKIRVMETDTNSRMMDLMGGVGTPMGQGEVYTAIQSGVIDGGENNESIYRNLKHDEVAPYYSYTNHLMIPDYLITNPATFDAMSEADRGVFLEELEAAYDESSRLTTEVMVSSQQAAEEAGAEFSSPDVEPFREAVAPLLDEKLTTPASRQLYDRTRAVAEQMAGRTEGDR